MYKCVLARLGEEEKQLKMAPPVPADMSWLSRTCSESRTSTGMWAPTQQLEGGRREI